MSRYITIILTSSIVLYFLWAMVAGPGDWDASAAYVATVEAPHGLTTTAPTFHGIEEMISSESVHVVNEYGTVGLDVNECWLTTFIAAAPGTLWEAGVSYRAGGASLEPVTAQDGIPILFQDNATPPNPTTWGSFKRDTADAYGESSTGDWIYYTTGAGNGFWMTAPGQVPADGTANRTGIGHDATDGWVESELGDLGLKPANGSNVTIKDSTGGADDYNFPDGDGNPGDVMETDGANQLAWASHSAILGGEWFLYDTASGDIGGYDSMFADPSVGGVQSYNIAIPASPTLIEEFATEIGDPGITFINNGIAEFHFHARISAGTMDARVYAEIYTRTHPGAAETLIATTEESNLLTGAEAAYEIHANVPFTAMNTTDRLVVKVYGNQYPPGANPTIQLYVEGTTNTRLELPVTNASSGLAHTAPTAVPVSGEAFPITLISTFGGAGSDVFVYVTCAIPNSDYQWNAMSFPGPVQGFITYYWSADSGDLEVFIFNDHAVAVEAVVWYGE